MQTNDFFMHTNDFFHNKQMSVPSIYKWMISCIFTYSSYTQMISQCKLNIFFCIKTNDFHINKCHFHIYKQTTSCNLHTIIFFVNKDFSPSVCLLEVYVFISLDWDTQLSPLIEVHTIVRVISLHTIILPEMSWQELVCLLPTQWKHPWKHKAEYL